MNHLLPKLVFLTVSIGCSSQTISLYRGTPIQCEDSEAWVVFQRRTTGTVDFDRTLSEYEFGFGTPGVTDFWLGLEELHELCPPHRPCEMQVDMKFEGTPREP